MKSDLDDDKRLICKPDSSDNIKAVCKGYIESIGDYYVTIGKEIEFKNLKVTVKKIPSIKKFSPISI